MNGMRSRLTLLKLRIHLVRYRFHGESTTASDPYRSPSPKNEQPGRVRPDFGEEHAGSPESRRISMLAQPRGIPSLFTVLPAIAAAP
jgi:hypothetical protein